MNVTSPSCHEALSVLTIVLKPGGRVMEFKSCSSLLFLPSQTPFSWSCISFVPCLITEIKDIAVERLEGYRNQRSHSNLPQLRLWLLTYPFIHLVMYSSPSPFLQPAAFSKLILGIPPKNDSLPQLQFIVSISIFLLIDKWINKWIDICMYKSVYLAEDGTRTAVGIDKWLYSPVELYLLRKT